MRIQGNFTRIQGTIKAHSAGLHSGKGASGVVVSTGRSVALSVSRTYCCAQHRVSSPWPNFGCQCGCARYDLPPFYALGPAWTGDDAGSSR